jgi:urea transport system substrate-binding protein
MMARSDRCLTLQGGHRPKAIRDAGTDAPEQIAAVDVATRHLWKQARIGKARPDGQFELVWNSDETLRPNPFPDYRSQSDWLQRVDALPGARP